MSSYSGDINFGIGKLHIKTSHNSKVQTAQVFIQFNTTEHELINELLRKYESEKFVAIGSNPNNKLEYYKANNDCCFAVMPESKVFNFIATIYKYLLTTTLSAASIKNCLTKKASYNKLHADVSKGFEVIVTGKCKALTNKLASKLPVIDALAKNMSSIKPKAVADIDAHAEAWMKPHDIAGSKLAKLYLVIFAQRFNFVINGNKLYCDDGTWSELAFFMKEHAPVAGGVIKSYLKQAGAKKSKASANDTSGSKMKASNDIALKNLNTIIEITCKLYGLPVETLTLASWDLDKAALAEMKKLIH